MSPHRVDWISLLNVSTRGFELRTDYTLLGEFFARPIRVPFCNQALSAPVYPRRLFPLQFFIHCLNDWFGCLSLSDASYVFFLWPRVYCAFFFP